MIATGIALSVGMLLALSQPQPVDIFWVSLLPALLFLIIIGARWRWFWVMTGGFLWATLIASWQLNQRLPSELNNKRLNVVGEVVNLPQSRDHASRFLFRVHSHDGVGAFNGLTRLSWRDAPSDLQAGEIWQLQVKLKQPHGFQNPGAFDYERWLFARGIHATGYVISKADNRRVRDAPSGLIALRHAINQSILERCAGCEYGGLIQALTVGYRGAMSEHERNILQQTGTAHLIAISGLHIGIIAGWFYVLGRLIWRALRRYTGLMTSVNRQTFALSLGWVAAMMYAVLSGFELPAQRAMLMLTVVVLAVLLRLPVNLLNSLFLALVVVLMLWPLSLLSASFWLSFGALLIIALGLMLFAHWRSKLALFAGLQLLFALLMAPLSIVLFSQLQLAGLLANLVAVPLISVFVVPFNFVLQGLFWIPDGWLGLLYQIEDRVLAGLFSYLEFLLQSGLSAIVMPSWSSPMLIVLGLLLMAVILPRGFPVPRSWLLLLPIVLFLAAEQRANRPEDLRMTIFDVGTGTSVLLQTRHHVLIYDVGPGRASGFSLGRWVVLPFLQSDGIHFVDRIVLSHADQDHMGGLLGIHAELTFAKVLTGTIPEVRAKWPQAPHLFDCHTEPEWTWDGVKFEFVTTDLVTRESTNNRSCVLRVETAGGSILLTGDIESTREAELLEAHAALLDVDFLVAAHHGSATSSSTAFVQEATPDHVIFSAGFANHWGFPRTEVVQRFVDVGAQVWRTDRQGAVTVRCDQSDCQIDSYRQQRPRLWY